MTGACVRSCVMGGLLPLWWSLVGCTPAAPPAREFELRGQILALNGDRELVIKHGDIKGFMPAMTMPYKVREPGILREIGAGDLITAIVAVSETDAVLTRVTKTGTAPITDPVPSLPAAARVALLAVGDPAPDTMLIDDQGTPLTLSKWRGSAVALTFIYTRCPLPQYCPLLDRRFGELQQTVEADPALEGKVHLVSVSFDPDTDRTAVLRAHATKVGADPMIWRFASAPRDTVELFAAAFGVNIIREADATITHNLRTAVIGPDGRVAALYDNTDWTVDRLVSDLRKTLTAR